MKNRKLVVTLRDSESVSLICTQETAAFLRDSLKKALFERRVCYEVWDGDVVCRTIVLANVQKFEVEPI